MKEGDLMNLTDFLYTSDVKLGEFLALFLQGYDDKVYINLYEGNDSEIIYEDIRIIDAKLNAYFNRKIIAMVEEGNLGIIIERE